MRADAVSATAKTVDSQRALPSPQVMNAPGHQSEHVRAKFG